MFGQDILLSKSNRSSDLVFFISSLGMGGAEKNFVALLNHFEEKGLAPRGLLLNESNTQRRKDLNAQIQLDELKSSRAVFCFIPLFKYIVRENPREFFVFNHQLACVLVFLRLICRFDYRIYSRNINYLSLKFRLSKSLWHGAIVGRITQLLYPKVDYFICQSQEMRSDLVSQFQIPFSRIGVIPNPIELQKYRPDPAIKKRNYLLFVGKLEAQKNVTFLLEAFAAIRMQIEGVKLILIGEGREKSRMEAHANELALTHSVEFLGAKSNTPDFYNGALVTLLTSHYEGFPNVLVESIACGTPVVAIDCKSGPSEIVCDENGALVPPGDMERFVKLVIDVVKKDWSRTAVAQTVSHLDMDVIGQKYLNVFKCSPLKHKRSA